ncbi:NAD(P)H-dependent oxidoreductase [Paenibacillus sp. GCM10023248]|uniref:NAD(P)H-dependent oxidoreductase n=1 Tax=Bacillales TaxID=1385 RepID=UPI00237882BB|nr:MULTISPECIES: NAD(P)H-dependent oxidoreductase [Bacillales]MDD9269705.1 NAD(P)H-dependent oxidoreductase [Paenibacillus sp. MAHUQ-63]MDR6881886.1 nitroreductase [Bacillus sp. 3255]
MTMTKEEILEVHHFRHATKQFDPSKTISDDDFKFILEVGRLSPSSFSSEPWRFVVVQNEQLRNKIKNASYGAASKLPEASHFVIILARTPLDMRYDSAYQKEQQSKAVPEERLARHLEIFEEFQRNDFKLLDHERFLTDWAIKQTYIPLANMMTAAAQIGIDSCPIEGFNIEKINQLLNEEELLEDGHFTISVMIAFGYRKKEPGPRIRLPFDDVVKWVK